MYCCVLQLERTFPDFTITDLGFEMLSDNQSRVNFTLFTPSNSPALAPMLQMKKTEFLLTQQNESDTNQPNHYPESLVVRGWYYS